MDNAAEPLETFRAAPIPSARRGLVWQGGETGLGGLGRLSLLRVGQGPPSVASLVAWEELGG